MAAGTARGTVVATQGAARGAVVGEEPARGSARNPRGVAGATSGGAPMAAHGAVEELEPARGSARKSGGTVRVTRGVPVGKTVGSLGGAWLVMSSKKAKSSIVGGEAYSAKGKADSSKTTCRDMMTLLVIGSRHR